MGDFKRISVTAAEEEDVVVRAGLPAGEPSELEASAAGEGAAAPGLAESPAAPGEAASAAPGPAAAPGAFEAPGAHGSPHQAAPAPDGPASRDVQGSPQAQAGHAHAERGFRETTLEDLEPAPMPSAQKIVIIAAVVCIIGALIYYFACMR